MATGAMRFGAVRKDGHAAMRLISGAFGIVCLLWIVIAAGSVIDPSFIPQLEGMVQSMAGGAGGANR